MIIRSLIAVIISFLAAGPELRDNPDYRAWATFKPGASVTTSTVTRQGNSTLSDVQATLQLVQVRQDRVILESSGSLEAGDSRMQLPVQREEIPARLKPEEQGKLIDEADETITIAGKEVRTRWAKRVSEAGSIRTEMTTWSCTQIPGGLARQRIVVVKGPERTVTVVEVMQFEAKR